MIIVFFFVTVLLCCIPPIHSSTETNNSTTICPQSFSCPGLGPYKYPFYNVTGTKCGLIKINCTSTGGEIQIEGRPYEIVGKYDHNSSYGSYNLVIHNETFEHLVNNNSCEALMNNFTFSSPSPLFYSITLAPFITLFKCTNKVNYFKQHKHKNYNKCKGYNFYYNYFNGTVPSDLPVTCQVLHLPVRLSTSTGLDETNISSLISSYPSILFELSTSCDNCRKNGSQCDDKDGRFQCLDIKEAAEKEGKEPPPIKILVIAGPALILMLSFVIFITWRHCKNNPFSYVSSKNKTTTLDDISVSCGISIFSNQELEDATKNFDQSHELGDGGFGAVYYGKLQDGRDVAVKKLHEHNYNRVQQFLTEVKILTKLRHPNLVVLYGCTSRQSHELLLVYEYVPNGTVFDHLHGGHTNPNLLTWPTRLNIAIETASALVYKDEDLIGSPNYIMHILFLAFPLF